MYIAKYTINPAIMHGIAHRVGSIEEGKLIGIRNRKYGRTVIGIYVHRPSGKLDDSAQSRPEEFVSF